MTTKRIFALLVALVALALVVAGCGSQGEPPKSGDASKKAEKIVIQLSHSSGPTSSWQKGAEKWAELVKERTNGRVEIQAYPSGQLTGGNQGTELTMLQAGDIGATMTSTIWYTNLEPKTTVFQMPWIIKDEAAADRLLDGPVGEEMLKMLEQNNIVGLAYGENGFRQLTNNKREIKTPDDLKGLKIRIPGIKLYTTIFKALGADPTVMTWGEAFTGLQQGTIDGQENPIVGMIIPNRVYEVQKYITLWNYSYDPIVLGVNRDIWNKLDADTQKILKETAQEAMKYQREVNRGKEMDKDPVEFLKEKGMTVTTLTDEERSAFQQLMEPVYAEYESMLGKDLIDKFKEAGK